MKISIGLIFLSLTLNCVKSDFFEVGITEGRSIPGAINVDLKVIRVNKTLHAVSGSLKFGVPLDNSYQVRLQIFKKQGNEYRLTPYHIGKHKSFSCIEYSVKSILRSLQFL